MSRYQDYDRDYDRRYGYSKRRRPRGKIMGVCAGMAEQFDWDVTWVRVAFVASLCLFTLPTFLLYIIAGALFY